MVFFWSIIKILSPSLHLVYTNIKLQCKRFVNSKIYYFTDFHFN